MSYMRNFTFSPFTFPVLATFAGSTVIITILYRFKCCTQHQRAKLPRQLNTKQYRYKGKNKKQKGFIN
jgi:hypothetical protein